MNKITLTILSALTATLIYAQAKFPGGSPGYFTPNPSSFVDVPAPEAASLGKYGDVGVSYFTGNPNISIPLYNLTVRDVNMPITLDYESSGVRVNSLPTWAGQNWTLNVGGVITRIVKGRYDEWIYPRQMQLPDAVNYFQCHDKLKELLGKNDNYKSLKNAAVYNYHDLAPDEYTFHFMGKSGKFFLDDTGSWRVQSDDNLEVIFDYNKSTNFISPLFAKYPKTTDYYQWRKQQYVTSTEDYIASCTSNRAFPWRIFALAHRDTEMLDNNMVYTLATPNRIGDTSWIRPGKVAWD